MICNRTRKKVIAEQEQLCSTTLSQARGLMFTIRPRPLVFAFRAERILSFHMLFVFYPIDVLFLDRNQSVIEMKEHFMPFTLYATKRPAQYAIELAAGTIRKTGTRLGDAITLGPEHLPSQQKNNRFIKENNSPGHCGGVV